MPPSIGIVRVGGEIVLAGEVATHRKRSRCSLWGMNARQRVSVLLLWLFIRFSPSASYASSQGVRCFVCFSDLGV